MLAAARGACAAGGWLVFTAEAPDDASRSPFRLQHHGRYARWREAVERRLHATGWQSIGLQAVVLRQQAGEPVHGGLASAQAGPRAPSPSTSVTTQAATARTSA